MGRLGIGLFVLMSMMAVLPAHAEERVFKLVGVEVGGAKFWVPSTMAVKKGDRVKVVLENRTEGKNTVLGFTIDEYKIKASVARETKRIDFVAAKAGIFSVKNHLHPDHVAGQLIVIE